MADMFNGEATKAIAGVPMEFRPRGLTDVKKQVRSIRWMVVLSTVALVVLTAVNLGMVVAGIHITRQFSLTEYPDGTVHLTKKGDGDKVVHVGQTYHEDLPLHSRYSDTYFKKLDSVTLNYELVSAPAGADAAAARRGLNWSVSLGGNNEGASHTIHAKVDGFQRLHCEDCASKTQVKLSTAYGHFIVRDDAVIPLLNELHFPGLDVKAFREKAATGQGVSASLVHKWNDSVSGTEIDVSAGGHELVHVETGTMPTDADLNAEAVVAQTQRRRALQSGLFDGERHGSWDATFDTNKDSDGSSHTTFEGNFEQHWKSSGGSTTDVRGHADWDFSDNSGHATVGIKHEW